MPRRRSNDFLVGAVVLVGLVAIVFATLWVSQADIGGRRERVLARFRDVGNAQVGNAVVLRGVRAGQIETMELAPGGWVTVGMAIDRELTLPDDAVVLLGESSLFGEWQASVMERSALPADDEVQRQIAEADGAPGMLPGATTPDIARLTAVAGRLAGDVATVADRVELAFDDTAALELRSSIRHFSAMSSTLATTVERQSRNLDALATDLRTGVATMNGAARAVQRVAERVDSSTATGQVHGIVTDVAATTAQLRQASVDLRATTAQLARTQARLDELLAHTTSVAAKIDRGEGALGLLVNDSSLYRSGDSLLLELRALVSDVRANPRRYVSLKLF
jgi:phospholipid/cholesterol/gamma-HCH transport system substrate-binding protein